MTVWDIYGQIDPIRGWMGAADCETLFNYASQARGLIVEIGSYCGRATKLMALASPESKVVTIDKLVMAQASSIRNELLGNIEGLNVQFIEGDSTDIGKDWAKPIDLLFIDGDHTFLQVQKDIALFAPHLKKNQYALLHDVDKEDDIYYGVKEAIESVKDKFFSEVIILGGIAVCKKK